MTQPIPITSPANDTANITADNGKAKRNEWLRELHARITTHQRYPSRARRRGQEDRVVMDVLIDAHGHLTNAVITDGKRVFHRSSLKALRASLPLPPPHGPEQLTLTINYHLYAATPAL